MTIMQDHVLKNQIIFGTVNASKQKLSPMPLPTLARLQQRWPERDPDLLITGRFPIDQAGTPLSGKVGGIKNVITL